MDEGREMGARVDTLRRTLLRKDGDPGTLAKHWANRPEGSLPSSLSQGTSIIKQHKERAGKSLQGKLTRARSKQSLLNFIRDLGAGTSALPLN